jgi:thiosulfate dehydrogenase (quinone) large subunit
MIERVTPSAWIRATLWLVARLWVGYQFLTAGWSKLFGDEQAAFVGSHAGAGIKGFLGFATSPQMTSGAHASVLPPYVWLAQHVFIPAAVPLGYMVAVGETLIGIALIVGLFTRFAAFWGAFLNLMFLLAGNTGVNPYMLTIELGIVLVGVTAGLIGLDYYVLPYVKTWWAQRGQVTTGIGLPHGRLPRPVH